jgi:predicted secreted protein
MEARTLNINERFEVVLKGKGTAGYTWEHTLSQKDIVSVEEKKQPAKKIAMPPLPGSSLDEIFTVTALKKGKVTLHFHLIRSWEPSSIKPKDEKKIEIEVV